MPEQLWGPGYQHVMTLPLVKGELHTDDYPVDRYDQLWIRVVKPRLTAGVPVI
ncbi:hypothetical protein PI125_g14195 [Phytophthora idaei]|nr:hypothetical protein PI125_g14195 [Phytophthora idaei]